MTISFNKTNYWLRGRTQYGLLTTVFMCVMNKYIWKSKWKIMLHRRWIQEMNNKAQTSFFFSRFYYYAPSCSENHRAAPACAAVISPRPPQKADDWWKVSVGNVRAVTACNWCQVCEFKHNSGMLARSGFYKLGDVEVEENTMISSERLRLF